MADIAKATEEDFARFYQGTQPTVRWIGQVIRRGRLIAGFGGVIEIDNGLWFAFLDVPAHLRNPMMYRHILEVLGEAKVSGATVIRAICDTSIPRAQALLTRLGFEPTDEMADDRQVWQWQLSEQ